MPRTRDEHLFARTPKRILAPDGGGVRTLMTLQILRRAEEILSRRAPDPAGFRLSDYFDLIGGASTGALVGLLLAMGQRVDEVIALWRRAAPATFRGWGPRVPDPRPRVSTDRLARTLADLMGDETLESPRLVTGFAAILRRADPVESWFVTNNPRTPFWETTRRLRLRDIALAGGLAPHGLDTTPIEIPGEGTVGMLDGGLGASNVPCVQLLLAATMPQYGFDWDTGPDRLFMLSCGAGTARPQAGRGRMRAGPGTLERALHLLGAAVHDAERMNIAMMQALSEPRRAWRLGPDIGGFEGGVLGGRELLSFRRVDVSLERDDERNVDDLRRTLGLELSPTAHRNLLRLDNGSPTNLKRLVAIGTAAGEKLVFEDDFPPLFDSTR